MKACRRDGSRAPLILNHCTGMALIGRLHRPHYLQEETSVSTEKKAECAAKPVWAIWRRDTSLALAGIRTPCRRTRRPVTVSTKLSRLQFFSELIMFLGYLAVCKEREKPAALLRRGISLPQFLEFRDTNSSDKLSFTPHFLLFPCLFVT
jgi:hypothetical protein